MSKPTKECLFTKDAPISAVELRKSHPTEEVDEQTIFADAARPLRAVPPCHHGAADAPTLQAWRYAGRPDGRVLHAASFPGRPPPLRADAGFAARFRLLRRAGYLREPSHHSVAAPTANGARPGPP